MEVRIHCLGGQGGVTAARIIGLAAVKDGRAAVAFPSFTVERRGAPVQAFVRVGEGGEIFDRSFVYRPDYVLIFDPKLVNSPAVLAGASESTKFLVNTRSPASAAKALRVRELAWVDALRLSLEVLKAPIVNTAMCGAFAAYSKLISARALEEAIREVLPPRLASANVEAALRAYGEVRVWLEEAE
ncbi:MAG: 2-oxoacid:acceptor oxidoreductase family protein [Candidatus Nezhaarchaeales archaeon]